MNRRDVRCKSQVSRTLRRISPCIQVRKCDAYQTGKMSTEVVDENCDLVDNAAIGGLQTNCLVIGKAR